MNAPRIVIPGREERLKNYITALKALGARPTIAMEAPNPEDFEGLLLPGGGDLAPYRYGQENRGSRDIDPVLDEAQLEVLRSFVQARRPILGICRGHQVINVYFGGTLTQDLPDAAMHTSKPCADGFHPVRALKESFVGRLYGREFVVNSAHHQGVDRLGGGLTAAAWAPDGLCEALYHETLPIRSVQWHPERLFGTFDRREAVDGGALLQAFLEDCVAQPGH